MIFFLTKVFHGSTNYFGQIYGGGGLHWGGTNNHMSGGEEGFTNVFSSNLNTVILVRLDQNEEKINMKN